MSMMKMLLYTVQVRDETQMAIGLIYVDAYIGGLVNLAENEATDSQ